MSNLSALEYIASPSAGTTGLWNQRFSVISANFAALNSDVTINVGSGNTVSIQTNLDVIGGGHFQFLSIGSTPPSYVTTAALTIEVNSTHSDYIYLVDSSDQKSSYVIGSRAGGLADGLNIWDASAGTMIASFSKQSIRFFQNVVGPVFDLGGALASTYNAATFGTGADSTASRIQAAIDQASIDGFQRVYLPASMLSFSGSSLSLIHSVQLVREGGTDWTKFDVEAYGASGNSLRPSGSAVQGAVLGASFAGGGVVTFSDGTYVVDSTISMLPNVILEGPGGRGYPFVPARVGIAILAPGSSALTRLVNMTQATNAGVVGLGMDGLNSGNSMHGVSCDTLTFSAQIVNCSIKRFTGYGINLERAQLFVVDNCFVSNNSQGALSLFTSRDGWVRNCALSHSSNSGNGIHLAGAQGNHIIDNRLEWNDGHGMRVVSGNDNIVVANLFDRNGLTGLYAGPTAISNWNFTNNHFNRNAAQGQNTTNVNRANICLDGASGWLIADNIFNSNKVNDDGTGATAPDYGVILKDTVRCIGMGNKLRDGAVTDDFVRTGTQTALRWFGIAESGDYDILFTDFSGVTSLTVSDSGQLSTATFGSAILPAIGMNSENSLGWYRSGVSTMALSYGTFLINALFRGIASSSVLPQFRYLANVDNNAQFVFGRVATEASWSISRDNAAFFSSARSGDVNFNTLSTVTMNLGSGTLLPQLSLHSRAGRGFANFQQSGIVSIRTVSTSLDSSTLTRGEMAFTVIASGMSLAIHSGNTIYFFASSASTLG